MRDRSGIPAVKKTKTAGYGATICMECKQPLQRVEGMAICTNSACALFAREWAPH